ncbi:endonuclease/exonuclease/phosphatase family protein [Psychromonas sp. 14N.309.X.WAT.B.A12]|uniref:endonuclease/exonuclease/phosphatase family protein n=1 Tax=Psychromonas sp. 14N.309.X.WAT.B.A12 TaxID=2998322 RepID=UPI0025B1E2B4|nr:endonuclease/exonuclease/phosphatase family protein [Psychromonas sp. 14N.309.X.WAT.B.A12]MDN2662594.1 endonuclease/exonuclease/phosphatase family protein [Psychromonas sp. 14N.309.X.WAT.B.A12]
MPINSISLRSSNDDLSSTEQVEQTQIKVATFNLFNYLAPPDAFYDFDRIYSAEQWQKKENWIASYLQKHQPDIIGFQEVFSIEALEILVKKQGYEYFAVVDKPTVIDDFIYRDPVVALVSKFPIVSVSSVAVDTELAMQLGLTAEFDFSRQVVRATVELPHLGLCDCYVVHFKSKRAAWQAEPDPLTSLEGKVIEQFKAQVAGGWASSIQRGSEATLLMMHMVARRAKTGNAMILMGDFNNPLQDGILAHLSTPNLLFNNDQQQQQLMQFYTLRDAWDLYESNQTLISEQPLKRAATHYFGQSSSVLDYILLSSEFDTKAQSNFFEVSDYVNTDKHLINPSFEIDGESTDHAVVSICLTLRQ